MKKFIKLFVFAAFIAVIAFPAAAQSLSGTFTYTLTQNNRSVEMGFTFSGNTWTSSLNGVPEDTGTFRVSGSQVFSGNSSSPFFTIVDENTLRDNTGNLWKRSGAASVTQGTITINGLRSHAGKYITGFAVLRNNKTLFFSTAAPSSSSVLGAQIPRNGTVTINVYIVDHPGNDVRYDTAAPYSGSDSASVSTARLVIIGTPNYQTSTDDIVFLNTQAISFRDGNATIDFSRVMRRE